MNAGDDVAVVWPPEVRTHCKVCGSSAIFWLKTATFSHLSFAVAVVQSPQVEHKPLLWLKTVAFLREICSVEEIVAVFVADQAVRSHFFISTLPCTDAGDDVAVVQSPQVCLKCFCSAQITVCVGPESAEHCLNHSWLCVRVQRLALVR